MSQRFLRCPHCGLPHAIDETACPVTGRPLEAKRSVRPDSDRRAQPAPAAPMMIASANPTARGGIGATAPPPSSQGKIPVASHPSSRGQMAVAPPTPFETTPPPTSFLGQTLGGKYKVIRVLGEGGMGAVYECEHVTLHRRVAIKVLHPTQAKKKASVQRFHHEAQVAGAIGHPNICEIYDIGETDDSSPFLVMELLHGETLADRIASEGALPFDDVIEIISQVLSGLIAAHDKGVIHRDIKPENVFLSNRPGIAPLAKLLDFGISKVAGSDELHLTRTGMVMGTPFYMSPEQARGDRNLDHRVDIYATGVMMYECLTGRRPFTAANYNALLVQILTTSARPPHELRPAVPPEFETLVLKAMHRERDKRFKNAAEMQRALVQLRDPVAAAAQRRIASIPPEPVPLVTPRRDPHPPSSRNESSRNRELDSISVDLDKPALLGDAAAESDSGSIEIPIVTDDVKSVSQPPVPPRPSTQPPPRSAALYKPPAQKETTTSKASPPIAPPPRTLQRAPSSQPIPPLPPRPSQNAGPISRPVVTQRGVQSPSRERETGKSLPPPIPSNRKPRMVTPTPTPVDPRLLGLAAPWLDHPLEGDPTEVGSLPEDAHDPTEVGPLLGLKRPNDTPIDPDATERVEPRFARSDRAPRAPASTSRPARELRGPRNADPRRESDAPPRPSTTDAPMTERVPEDEQPTTLFDRSKMKGSLPPGQALGRHTTERAPASPSREEATSPPAPRAPRRG